MAGYLCGLIQISPDTTATKTRWDIPHSLWDILKVLLVICVEPLTLYTRLCDGGLHRSDSAGPGSPRAQEEGAPLGDGLHWGHAERPVRTLEPVRFARSAQSAMETQVLCPSNKCGKRSFVVPYLPSSQQQTVNVLKQLRGRSGRLADLGSGDGRLVLAASSAGFQCTGFEINSILVAYARAKAQWTGLPCSHANFVKTDFWKTDLSSYNNVTAFLAPGVMEVLGEKLLKELPDDAFVVACRFPFPHWPPQSSLGSGLDQTWAYDLSAVRASLSNSPSANVKLP